MAPVADRLASLTEYSSLLSKKLSRIDPVLFPRASVILALYTKSNTTEGFSNIRQGESILNNDNTEDSNQDNAEEYYIWLNIRANHLKHHPGEVCFPGGKREPQDISDLAAGLREAREEFGLSPSSSFQYLTILDPSLSRSLSVVQPIVGLVSAAFEPVLAADEVASAFSVPLKAFMSKKYYSHYDITLKRPWETFYKYRVHSFQIPFHVCDRIVDAAQSSVSTAKVHESTDEHSHKTHASLNGTHKNAPIQYFRVWGLTAQFLVQLVHTLYSGKVPYPIQSPASELSFTEIADRYISWSLSKFEKNKSSF